jgi:hypothetical protein
LPKCSASKNLQSFGGLIDPTTGAMMIGAVAGYMLSQYSGLLVGILGGAVTFFILPNNCGECVTSGNTVSNVSCGF